MSRQTKAIIDLDAIAHNYQLAQKWAKASENIAVIKANAYGHGAREVAIKLEPLVKAFAVAIFEEAVELRSAGILKPILILQGINSVDEVVYAAENNCWLMVHQPAQIDILSDPRLTNLPATIKLWLKVDTGMHRLGFNPENVASTLVQLSSLALINKELVLCSHFSHAADIQHNKNRRQLKRFDDLFSELKKNKRLADFKLIRSMANSPAIAALPASHYEWNRPGIMLYGVGLFDIPHVTDRDLKPAMHFISSIIALRKIKPGQSVGYGGKWVAQRATLIATVAVGYADGYPRQVDNNSEVFVRGRRAPVVGTVSMDMITVDVTDITDVSTGDAVELWGKNIMANVVAQQASTIGYHLLTSVSARVPREYVQSSLEKTQ